MTSAKLFVILALMALALTLPSVALAQQVPPHLSLITATFGGETAPDGTVITAMMVGKDDVTATVANGQAVIVFEGVAGDTGATISFMVGDFAAAENDTWEQGGHSDASLTLSASSVPVEPGRVVQITLSELNGSGQSGTATLTELGGKTQVVLSLSVGALETELVHIHLGQCGADNLGDIEHDLTSFVGGSGDSTTLVPTTLDSLLDGDHAINSHEAGNPGNYTSCGNLPTGIPAMVATAWAGLIQYLVDDRGFSLYLLTNDTRGASDTAPVATCTSDGCTATWAPLWTAGEPVALDQPQFGSGANQDLLGTLEWEDGNVQATYNGWPLYHYSKDEVPGDVRGQGLFGAWWVLDTGGSGITSVGPAGPQGETGPGGAAGATGNKGETGDAGATGPAGAKGDKGNTGDAGAGDDGAAGPAGLAGPAGAAGLTGEKGDSGSGALGIVALILAIIALVGAGGVFLLRRGV